MQFPAEMKRLGQVGEGHFSGTCSLAPVKLECNYLVAKVNSNGDARKISCNL